MEEFRQGFIEEALLLTEKLEEILISFDNRDVEVADVQEIFRVMHTLKGSSAMFGFKNTENLTHIVEDVFDKIRSRQLELTPQIIELTIQTSDLVKNLLQHNDILGDDLKLEYDKIVNQTAQLIQNQSPGNSQNEGAVVLTNPEITPDEITERYYYILFKPDVDVLQRGIAPISIFEELGDLGQITGFPFIDDVPLPENYNTSLFYMAWDIFFKTKAGLDEIDDCFLFYLEHEYKIIEISPADIAANKEFLLNCISLNKGIITLEQIIDKLEGFTGENFEFSQKKNDLVNSTVEKENTSEQKNSIDSVKVDSAKLDELINLVSELVTLNSRLEIISQELNHDTLNKTIKSVSKLSKRFRDNALELRLIPVKVLVLKMQRLIRDLSVELGKDVELITEGTNTELDKNIISRLEAPLMHILRNSLDHGIELPAEREKLNKPRKGVIRFVAFYSGSNVYIQVQDDGRGIDLEQVKQIATDKGLINKNEQISKQEIINLLFTPGFSTAESVSNISGRGVGLDIVKKEITDMRGEIDIESEKSLGTSFTLKLPLTLSIIDTLMVKVDESKILIPREYVINTDKFTQNKTIEKSDKIGFKGKIIPLISLRDDFLCNSEVPEKQNIVIISQYEKFYALLVDKIIGEHQAVVKPLGFFNQNHDCFSGASILGDGNLAFILDINKIISNKKNKSKIGNFNIK